jgi:predicted DsbA family dithiol-disulfide isomerase
MAVDVNIDIVSDVICPWCFIGRRRLAKALAALDGSLQATIVWRPFELNPGIPREGIERATYLAAKFGSIQDAQKLYEHVGVVGAEEGIEFHFDRIARTPNTFDAHRLIWLASRSGLGDAIAQELFKAYFVEGVNIGSRAALAQIGARAGLDPIETERFLESEEGGEEVRRQILAAQELGVSGVPFFVVNGRYGISGAQHPDTLVAMLKRAAAAAP